MRSPYRLNRRGRKAILLVINRLHAQHGMPRLSMIDLIQGMRQTISDAQAAEFQSAVESVHKALTDVVVEMNMLQAASL